LYRARDTGELTATQRLILVQETGHQFGFLIFMPIYSDRLLPTTMAMRRQNLSGFVVAAFRLHDMVEAALHGVDRQGLELWIIDALAPDGERLLYGFPRDAQTEDGAAFDAMPKKSRSTFHWSTTLELAGHYWTLHFAPTLPYLVTQHTWQPWAIQLGCLLLTGLLGAFLLVITSRTTQVERLVAERTTELQQANTWLQTEIGERRRAEAELARTNAELRSSNQELEQFAYIASHDLKAPLRGIAHLTTWIEEDLTDVSESGLRQKIVLLRGRVRRLETLLDDLLEYSRVGRVTETVKVINTRVLVTDVITLLAPPEGFTVTVAETLPTFDTAEKLLRQVFMNLLSNAIKHHDRPEGHIEITVRDQGKYYEFLVTDDGPGIAPMFHTRIFQMFQTLKSRDEVEGSGMGLALVKKVIEGQGGTVCVESDAIHRGTTMRFTWRKQWQGRQV
jgi:signal transduction histidine kinase